MDLVFRFFLCHSNALYRFVFFLTLFPSTTHCSVCVCVIDKQLRKRLLKSKNSDMNNLNMLRCQVEDRYVACACVCVCVLVSVIGIGQVLVLLVVGDTF